MKKVLGSVILLLALCEVASPQVSLEKIIPMLDTHLVKASFSCTIGSSVEVKYSGTALAQDNCFVVKAGGLESYCDGERIVVIDPESREIYIESAVGFRDYLEGNLDEVKEISFSELRFLPKETDLTVFSYSTDSLGKDWVITDLRQE